MWKRISAVAGGCLLALAGSLPVAGQGGPAADKPVQLAIAHWLPPAHPLQASTKAWIDAITAQSGGTVTGRIFPAEQLGKAVDHFDMARDGIADVTLINPGYQPGRFPIIAAGELPFLFHDSRKGTAALDAWYRKYAAVEMPDVHYCLLVVHDPGTFHSRKRILVPADIRGMKIRPANATIGAWVRLMGGSNVQASAPAARDLMEHGVADAIANPWGSIILFGIDQIAKQHIDDGFYGSVQMWVMNKADYKAMSPTQRKAVDNQCTTEAAVRFASGWIDFEAAGKPKLAAEGSHTINKLTPDQLRLWRDSAAPLKTRWADRVRARRLGDPDVMFAELEASLAKYDATYR